jgi:hypothetical protein
MTSSLPRIVTSYQPQFTEEQLAEARRVAAQHSASHAQVLRARLALVLAENPSVAHEIAGERCGLKKHTVYKWRRRWCQQGWSLEDAPRPGRPSAFSP